MLDLGSDAVPPIRHFLLWTNTHTHVRAPKHKNTTRRPAISCRGSGSRSDVSDPSLDGDEIDSGCNILRVHTEVRGCRGEAEEVGGWRGVIIDDGFAAPRLAVGGILLDLQANGWRRNEKWRETEK